MKYTDTFVKKWDGNILIEMQLEEMKTQQNVLGREERTFDVKENQKLVIFSQLKPITKNLDAQTKTNWN